MTGVVDVMSRSNRNVSDISRQELEDIIFDLDEEIESRKLKIHELRIINDQLLTRVEVAHETVRKSTMTYITPPESKIENKLVKKTKEQMTFNRDYSYEPTTSYNPYQAGNKHIVTMRHKVTDLMNKISSTNEERKKLESQREKMKNKLESREFGKVNPFRHYRVMPVGQGNGKYVTFDKCAKLCEKFMMMEEDVYRFHQLECVFNLLTGNDKESLREYSDICMPSNPDQIMEELDNMLSDRSAQASILNQQFHEFLRKHEKMVHDFLLLKDSMKKKSDNTDLIEQGLLEQIEDLKNRINEIPKTQNHIKELTHKREELYVEIDKVRENRMNNVENEAKLKADTANYEEEKLGYKLQAENLEREEQHLKSLREERISQISSLESEIKEMKQKSDDYTSKIRDDQVSLDLLEKAGITTPVAVNDIYELSNQHTVQDISDKHQADDNNYQSIKRVLDELKDECKMLVNQDDELQNQIDCLRNRIITTKKISIDAIRDEETDF